MLNKFGATACAVLIMSAYSLQTQAADVTDVRVIGSVSPAACTPVLSGGGTIDYGNIGTLSLSATDFTILPVKETILTVTCDAPAKVALGAVSARLNSVAGATSENAIGAGQVSNAGGTGGGSVMKVGLGLAANGAKIGGYNVSIGSMTIDGSPAALLLSDDTHVTWAVSGVNTIFNASIQVPRYFSPASAGNTDPVAFTTMTAKYQIQAYINKSSELDLSSPIDLDGLTTIDIVYL